MMTSTNTPSRLEARDLTVDIGSVRVASDLNFCIRPAEFWAVLGQNGVGKTTLLKALAGVHPATRGHIALHGQPAASLSRRQMAKRLAMLTQQTQYAFDATCHQTVLVGRHPHLKPWMRESQHDHQLDDQALKALGLAHLAQRSCMDLSGGESRRLAMASVLVQDPDLFVLDEPTNHLDPANQVALLNVVGQHIKTNNKAGIMALHEVNLATCYCTHCLLLFGEGEWLAGPTETLLTTENLSRLYDCPMRLVDDGQHTVFAVAGQRSSADQPS